MYTRFICSFKSPDSCKVLKAFPRKTVWIIAAQSVFFVGYEKQMAFDWKKIAESNRCMKSPVRWTVGKERRRKEKHGIITFHWFLRPNILHSRLSYKYVFNNCVKFIRQGILLVGLYACGGRADEHKHARLKFLQCLILIFSGALPVTLLEKNFFFFFCFVSSQVFFCVLSLNNFKDHEEIAKDSGKNKIFLLLLYLHAWLRCMRLWNVCMLK